MGYLLVFLAFGLLLTYLDVKAFRFVGWFGNNFPSGNWILLGGFVFIALDEWSGSSPLLIGVAVALVFIWFYKSSVTVKMKTWLLYHMGPISLITNKVKYRASLASEDQLLYKPPDPPKGKIGGFGHGIPR